MNWFNFLKPDPDMAPPILYDESTFYQAFMRDLKGCKKEAIIESPFITSARMETIYPIFKRILDRGIKIHIITRDPIEHVEDIRYQATEEILISSDMGVNVILVRGYFHKKISYNRWKHFMGRLS